jgi:hypothetical protein
MPDRLRKEFLFYPVSPPASACPSRADTGRGSAANGGQAETSIQHHALTHMNHLVFLKLEITFKILPYEDL